MKKRKTARNRVFTFMVLLVFVLSMFSIRAFPAVSTSTSAGESLLSARIWVDKGCDGHYKGGERITIFFEVKSSEPEAAVTILLHTPDKRVGHVISGVVYPTNTVHSLSAIAECPKGRYWLEIFVANVPSPPGESPPDELQMVGYIDIDKRDASDECFFYVDPPCVVLVTDNDNDGYSPPNDCNDNNSHIHPGAKEKCDQKDNDCDGQTDEGCYTCFIDNDQDGYTTCNDCNDHDSSIHPRASEFCDGKDNDCDGQIDEDCVACSTDSDGDGYTNCDDCNDYDFSVYPGAAEACDGKDNNCNGQIDEGCPICFTDYDGDGFSACSDCNDNNPYVYPGAPEFCDDKDNDCDGQVDEGLNCGSVDIWIGRGCGASYNDGDAVGIYFKVKSAASSAEVTITRFPPKDGLRILVSDRVFQTNTVHHLTTTATCLEGLEILIIVVKVVVDGKTVILFDYCAFYVAGCRTLDSDGDGHAVISKGGDDCDDHDSSVHPGAEEECDGKDNDCNGLIDEGGDCEYVEVWVDKKCGAYYNDEEPMEVYFRVNSSTSSAEVTIMHFPSTGEPNVVASERTFRTNEVYHFPMFAVCPKGLQAVVVTVKVILEGKTVVYTEDCTFYVTNCRPLDSDGDGHVSVPKGGDDCDDNDAGVYPGAEEVCDGKDNDCDKKVDEGFDTDEDGYTECENDCNENDPDVNPGAEEECNDGIDNDCDKEVDETADKDNDGYRAIECGGDDCDDNDPDVNPGAEEKCDQKDNDCDGLIDEGFDNDNDGYRAIECGGDDCDDNDPDVNPGAVEVCDQKDNNCNGLIDEGFDMDNDGYTSCGGDCDDHDPDIYPGAEEVCDDNVDNDCDEDVDETADKDNDWYKSRECGGNDCDDSNSSIHPGVNEKCDGKDNDCDELIDEGFDRDDDGYTSCEDDCDDYDPAINPDAAEVFDGKDNDCDGEIDEGVSDREFRAPDPCEGKVGCEGKILPVPYSNQFKTQWCFLNSLSMVLRYYGKKIHAWDIAEDEEWNFGNREGVSLYTYEMIFDILSGNKVHNYVEKIDSSLSVEGPYWTEIGHFLDSGSWFEHIRKNIDEGSPIIFSAFHQGEAKPRFAGHAIVITGYSIENGEKWLFVHDPGGAFVRDEWNQRLGWNLPTGNRLINAKVRFRDLLDYIFFDFGACEYIIKSKSESFSIPGGNLFLNTGSIGSNLDETSSNYTGLYINNGLCWKSGGEFLRTQNLIINPWISNQWKDPHIYRIIVEISDSEGNTRIFHSDYFEISGESYEKYEIIDPIPIRQFAIPIKEFTKKDGEYKLLVKLVGKDSSEQYTYDRIGPIEFVVASTGLRQISQIFEGVSINPVGSKVGILPPTLEVNIQAFIGIYLHIYEGGWSYFIYSDADCWSYDDTGFTPLEYRVDVYDDTGKIIDSYDWKTTDIDKDGIYGDIGGYGGLELPQIHRSSLISYDDPITNTSKLMFKIKFRIKNQLFGLGWTESEPIELSLDLEPTLLKMRSPADVHVYDSKGRHVGIDYRNGAIDQEIPEVRFFKVGDETNIMIFGDLDDYSIKVVGLQEGEYHLTIVDRVEIETPDANGTRSIVIPIIGEISRYQSQYLCYNTNQIASQISQEATRIIQESGLIDMDETTKQQIIDKAIQKVVNSIDSDGDGIPDVGDTDPVPSKIDWSIFITMNYIYFLLGILGVVLIILVLLGISYMRKKRS